mgnify:FL=1
MKNLLLACVLCICCQVVTSQTAKHTKTTKYPSYKGLVMAGYQGWFRAPSDGMLYPDETKVRLDMWPDVSEYEKT